jgi:hypothetical protein
MFAGRSFAREAVHPQEPARCVVPLCQQRFIPGANRGISEVVRDSCKLFVIDD